MMPPFRTSWKRKSTLLILVAALPSCLSIFGGADAEMKRISGYYILESVDGVPIPANVAPQQDCNRTVRKVAEFVLSPGGVETAPWYSWEIKIDANCQPVPAGVYQGADDTGSWDLRSNKLSFRSILGRGSYSATLDESSDTPAVTFLHLGNSYRFRRLDDPMGVVFVTVVDQFGQPVEGVILHFTFQHGIESGGTIGPAHEYGTRGPVGECIIQMTPPEGYAVPATQPNPFTVTIVEEPNFIRVQAQLTKL